MVLFSCLAVAFSSGCDLFVWLCSFRPVALSSFACALFVCLFPLLQVMLSSSGCALFVWLCPLRRGSCVTHLVVPSSSCSALFVWLCPFVWWCFFRLIVLFIWLCVSLWPPICLSPLAGCLPWRFRPCLLACGCRSYACLPWPLVSLVCLPRLALPPVVSIVWLYVLSTSFRGRVADGRL